MLKVLGSMLILLASVGFGFQIQMDLKNHLRLLYDIRKLLFDIANETAYTMDSMEVVLEHSIHSRNPYLMRSAGRWERDYRRRKEDVDRNSGRSGSKRGRKGWGSLWRKKKSLQGQDAPFSEKAWEKMKKAWNIIWNVWIM